MRIRGSETSSDRNEGQGKGVRRALQKTSDFRRLFGLPSVARRVTQRRLSTTSKSPRTVLTTAHAADKEVLPEYAHRDSPMNFTRHQLLSGVVLKEFLRLLYACPFFVRLTPFTTQTTQLIDLHAVDMWARSSREASGVARCSVSWPVGFWG